MGRGERWIPLHDALGKGPVPLSAARVIRLGVEAMKERGDLQPKAEMWQAFELWAADYLAGPDKVKEEG